MYYGTRKHSICMPDTWHTNMGHSERPRQPCRLLLKDGRSTMCIKQTVALLHLTCTVYCVQCISFIIICLVVYFIVVLPMNSLMSKFFVSPLPPNSLQAHAGPALEPLT